MWSPSQRPPRQPPLPRPSELSRARPSLSPAKQSNSSATSRTQGAPSCSNGNDKTAHLCQVKCPTNKVEIFDLITSFIINRIRFICLKVLRIILRRLFFLSKRFILIILFSQLIILHEHFKIFMIKLIFLNGAKIKRSF